MKTTHRGYSEEQGDFCRLAKYFTAVPVARRTETTWCLGRYVDWKYGLYPNKRSYASFCEENAEVWFDGFGELAAFVVSESGDATFSILTLPGYRFLFEELLQWALEIWQDRATSGCRLSTEMTEYQSCELRLLERYGFRPTSRFSTRRFDLTRELPARFPLELGFRIVDLQQHPNYRAQSLLRANAFQNKEQLSEAEMNDRLKYFNYNTRGPLYHPQTDLCIMTANGEFAAGCEALINAPGLEADIERVCTHSAFRRRGLARAVIQECLCRLQAMGLRNAYLTGYSPEALQLYGALGAVDEVNAFFYELPA